jgi:hypothetical protein
MNSNLTTPSLHGFIDLGQRKRHIFFALYIDYIRNKLLYFKKEVIEFKK